MIVHIPTIAIPRSTGLRRDPPRALENRQADYEDKFDFNTLIFDAIYLPDTRSVILICPPAMNLESVWKAARFIDSRNQGQTFPFELVKLDRLLEVIVSDVDPTSKESISLEIAGQPIPLPIADDQSNIFSERKVLFTVSRDNDLGWITDWAEYHAKVHGIDGVLLFDNGSTSYSCAELSAALSMVSELKAIQVVDWRALWGPTAGPSGLWDSNFGQHGAFEVARWRFLREASLVVNADIDELLLPLSDKDLKSACEASQFGAIHFVSRWVVGISGVTPAHTKTGHRDFTHLLPPGDPRARQKWAICPRRAANIMQWRTHHLPRYASEKILTADFEIRHFREVNTGWKESRKHRHNADDPGICVDGRLIEIFDRIGWRR